MLSLLRCGKRMGNGDTQVSIAKTYAGLSRKAGRQGGKIKGGKKEKKKKKIKGKEKKHPTCPLSQMDCF